jgi:hypothetical protein
MNYIAVCTPARDMVHTNYTYCMVNMVAYHTLNTTDAVSLKILQGTLIQNQRADLCLDAMREGCSHILFIDSDMTFPQDMIQRLLAHDVDIVAWFYIGWRDFDKGKDIRMIVNTTKGEMDDSLLEKREGSLDNDTETVPVSKVSCLSATTISELAWYALPPQQTLSRLLCTWTLPQSMRPPQPTAPQARCQGQATPQAALQ